VPSAPNNREANQPKILQHTFSNLAKFVDIFFIFWQAEVRRACKKTNIFIKQKKKMVIRSKPSIDSNSYSLWLESLV
jgi:hypothetical protein